MVIYVFRNSRDSDLNFPPAAVYSALQMTEENVVRRGWRRVGGLVPYSALAAIASCCPCAGDKYHLVGSFGLVVRLAGAEYSLPVLRHIPGWLVRFRTLRRSFSFLPDPQGIVEATILSKGSS